MITEQFYIQLASYIKSEPEQSGSLYLAIGEGDSAWDKQFPQQDRRQSGLVKELFRKPVLPEDIEYLDAKGETSTEATAQLQITTHFHGNEGEGRIRECGLLIRAHGKVGSGELLAYFRHPAVNKALGSHYERRLNLNLQPGSPLLHGHKSRYLGNSKTLELHDLENEKTNCQISEIRVDRRYYFASPLEAKTLDYDLCGICFGRELSER